MRWIPYYLFIFMSVEFAFAIQPDRVVPYKNLGDSSLKLDIYYPNNQKPETGSAVMLFYFGGGWNGGSTRAFAKQSKYLSSRGIVCICVEYRTKKSHGVDPFECVKDARSAYRFVYENAKDLGIDRDQILTGGGSAGGHLAVACSTVNTINDVADDLSIPIEPKAHVLFNPVYDNGPGGYGHDRVVSNWKAFSPLHNINAQMPPTLVMFGDQDKLMKVSKMKEFKVKMESVGVRSELVLYEGQAHAFFNEAKYSETVLEMDQFLQSLGFLSGPATIKISKAEPMGDLEVEKYNQALIDAVKQGNIGKVSESLDHGADIHVRFQNENTPLHLAILKGNYEMVRTLVEFGADIGIENKYGTDSLELAIKRKQNEIVDYLKKQK
jgi:acetyl esterase/lipase